MLKNLRNVVLIKAMMWIVAISFVALMVFDWGAGGMTCAGPGDTVGVINGQKVSHQQFVEALRDASRQAKDRNSAEPEESQLIRQIWDQMVAQILYAQQIEAHEIAVSDAEVNFINRNQPSNGCRTRKSFRPMANSIPRNTAGSWTTPARTQARRETSSYSAPNTPYVRRC